MEYLNIKTLDDLAEYLTQIKDSDPEIYAQIFLSRAEKAQMKLDQKPLLDDLVNAGAPPLTVGGNMFACFIGNGWPSNPYPETFDVLVKHLNTLSYDFNYRMQIANSFDFQSRLNRWDDLIKVAMNLQNDPGQFIRGSIFYCMADAVKTVVNKNSSFRERTIEIVKNPEYGPLRKNFLSVLRHCRHPDAKAALEDVRDVPEFQEVMKGWRGWNKGG